jgi:AraC family transcriptional regulator
MKIEERFRNVAAAPEVVRLPGFVVTVGVHAASTSLPRHEHDLPTLCIVRQGRFTEYYPGKSVDCDSRMVKVTPAGEPHWNRFDCGNTLGARVDVETDRFADAPAVRRLLDERAFFRSAAFDGVAHRLLRELSHADGATAVAAEGLLLELLANLARAPGPRDSDRPPWLLRADEIVHDRFRTDISLSQIAELVGVHPTTLARAYRRAFGCTVGERIRRLRVEHAAQELVRSRMPLSQVALRAGFYDQSHFSNAFRRHMLVTPAEYRRRYG